MAIDSGGLMQLASKYTFKMARPPVHTPKSLVTAKNKGVKLADNPSAIDIAAVNAGPILGVQIVAKVTSDKPYRGLGIGKGDNYIVLRTSGPNRKYSLYSITPFHETVLTRTTDEYSSGPPSEPRLVYNEFESSPGPQPMTNDMVAYAFCFEDDLCTPTHHCGYNNF